MKVEAQNKLFPIFLKLENFRVLIVGGGKVGLEKVSAVLLNSPATTLKIVAKEISQEIKDFIKDYENVTLIEREYSS